MILTIKYISYFQKFTIDLNYFLEITCLGKKEGATLVKYLDLR